MKSPQLNIEIGDQRKHDLKMYALRNRTTITQILIDHIDSILAEEKKLEAPVNPLGLPNNYIGQSTIDHFVINPLRIEDTKLETIRKYLLFNADNEEITRACIVGNKLKEFGNVARLNYDRRELIRPI
jgi:hypothetical protein